MFVHGEFYASNILVSPGRVCPVDWEMAGIGPGVLDLAALATAWEGADRARIVAAYADERGAPVDEEDLDAARLVLAVQWLGWAEGWEPPREHATDWLAEATAAHDDSEREGARRQRRRLRLQRGRQPGVAEAHERGIVTSASLMVRWDAADTAAAYARSRPQLGVGLHLDLGEWVHRDGTWVALYERVDLGDRMRFRRSSTSARDV